MSHDDDIKARDIRAVKSILMHSKEPEINIKNQEGIYLQLMDNNVTLLVKDYFYRRVDESIWVSKFLASSSSSAYDVEVNTQFWKITKFDAEGFWDYCKEIDSAIKCRFSDYKRAVLQILDRLVKEGYRIMLRRGDGTPTREYYWDKVLGLSEIISGTKVAMPCEFRNFTAMSTLLFKPSMSYKLFYNASRVSMDDALIEIARRKSLEELRKTKNACGEIPLNWREDDVSDCGLVQVTYGEERPINKIHIKGTSDFVISVIRDGEWADIDTHGVGSLDGRMLKGLAKYLDKMADQMIAKSDEEDED